MVTKFDARQTIVRDAVTQLATGSDKEVDNLLVSADSELKMPFRMSATGSNRTITIDSISITNPEHSRNRIAPQIANTVVTWTTGSVVFPSSHGPSNAIQYNPSTSSIAAAHVPTLSSGNFIKGLIHIDNSGAVGIRFGTQNASEASATLPKPIPNFFTIGYVTLKSTDGTTIDLVTNAKLYQYSQNPTIATPTSVTDNAVARWDAASQGDGYGNALQASPLIIDDSGNASGIADLTISGTLSGVSSLSLSTLTVAGQALLGPTSTDNTIHQIRAGLRYRSATATNTNLVISSANSNLGINFVRASTTSSAVTVTLPSPASVGADYVLTIKDVGGNALNNNITIARAGSESIDGVAASAVISNSYGCITVYTDGTNWFLI